MERLTDSQIDIIRELIEESLQKAALSMEQMLRIRVEPDHIIFGNGPLDSISEFDFLGRFKVHLVKVNFKGQIKGAFYFIINAHEVDLINDVSLPPGFSSDNRSENKMMKHGFMSEIENLIAALSLDEISKFLGVQLQSEVPEIQILKGSDVNLYLENENNTINTAFHVKCVLSGTAVNISPFFIWMLDQNFIKQLKLNIVS